MNNKAILAFINKNNNTIKYGKWKLWNGKLYFNWVLIAEFSNNKVVCYEQNLSDCYFGYQTYHAISKVIRFLEEK